MDLVSWAREFGERILVSRVIRSGDGSGDPVSFLKDRLDLVS